MKLKVWMIVIITILAVSGFLFSRTDTFSEWNISQVHLGERKTSLNDQLLSFVKKDYSNKVSVESPKKSTFLIPLILDRRIGPSKKFNLHFDDDYSNLVIEDLEENQFFILEGPSVLALYMHPLIDDFYDYKNSESHELIYDNQKIDTESLGSWKYSKADGIWDEVTTSNKIKRKIIESQGSLDFKVESKRPSKETKINIYNQEELIYRQKGLDDLYVPKEEGLYTYEIISYWEDAYYFGDYKSYVDVKVNLPPTFYLSQEIFEQGETIFLIGENINDLDSLFVESSYFDQLEFQKQGDNVIVQIPSTYYTTPGSYDISCGGDGKNFQFSFELLPRDFQIQYLTVSSQTTAATQTTEAYAEYYKYYYAALKENIYEPSVYDFKGEFLLPAMGRLTTEFGVSRYVNNKKTSYRHAGIDIAAPIGTEIFASYDGEVVMARYLTVTGNSIVISHGQGIFSTYFHLNELGVEKGDRVKKGDWIGAMGTTGFSTGSHLHFGISYFNMNLEPGHFIYKQAITYENYKALFEQ